MTGLFDGLGTLILLSMSLWCYTPLITTLVLREARILDFVVAPYRLDGYVLMFLALGACTLFVVNIYTLDGILVFALLNTLIFLYCRIRKLLHHRRTERHNAGKPK